MKLKSFYCLASKPIRIVDLILKTRKAGLKGILAHVSASIFNIHFLLDSKCMEEAYWTIKRAFVGGNQKQTRYGSCQLWHDRTVQTMRAKNLNSSIMCIILFFKTTFNFHQSVCLFKKTY